MPWDPAAPSNPKYKTKQHRAERAKWVKLMQVQGYLICAQPVCVMGDRTIMRGTRWHTGHDATGTTYIGPVHVTCNTRDGAIRGNRMTKTGLGVGRWAL